MAKLTKQQWKLHEEASELLKKQSLTDDDKICILTNWHEGAERNATDAGTFFTPFELACDFALDVFATGRIVDVCAGIGALSFSVFLRNQYTDNLDITCVEINPRFCEIGEKILPQATWICGDIFEIATELNEPFNAAYSNPPFGKIGRTKADASQLTRSNARYRGSDMEFQIMELCGRFASYGTFLVPSQSAPFRYSGAHCFDRRTKGKGVNFETVTGLYLEAGCGIDTSIFADQWKSTNIITEVVTIDYDAARDQERQEADERRARFEGVTDTQFTKQPALI